MSSGQVKTTTPGMVKAFGRCIEEQRDLRALRGEGLLAGEVEGVSRSRTRAGDARARRQAERSEELFVRHGYFQGQVVVEGRVGVNACDQLDGRGLCGRG